MTTNGLLYKDRFVSRGKEAFNFQFFKFGGAPDESLSRAQDATLKIRMSSVIYVHTQRFFSELMAFFNTFNQLMAASGHHHQQQHVEPPSPSPKAASDQQSLRGMRVRVDLEAGSPLLILPMSSFATQVLVVDLGKLEVHNTFKFSGDEGTISSQTLASAASVPDRYTHYCTIALRILTNKYFFF